MPSRSSSKAARQRRLRFRAARQLAGGMDSERARRWPPAMSSLSQPCGAWLGDRSRASAAICAALAWLARTPASVEPATRKLVCACDACAILFSEAGETKYKRVPRRMRFLRDFQMTDGQWDSLMIPIGMAFFLKSSVEERVVAFYPSPAGATESLLSLEAWKRSWPGESGARKMESDVEALLVNRLDTPGARILRGVRSTNATSWSG